MRSRCCLNERVQKFKSKKRRSQLNRRNLNLIESLIIEKIHRKSDNPDPALLSLFMYVNPIFGSISDPLAKVYYGASTFCPIWLFITDSLSPPPMSDLEKNPDFF